jgi:hypothetical protein
LAFCFLYLQALSLTEKIYKATTAQLQHDANHYTQSKRSRSMPDPESELSAIAANTDRSKQREPGRRINETVHMRVTIVESAEQLTYYKTFTVAARRMHLGRWQYQLTDPRTNSLWNEEDWVQETELRGSRN